MAAVTPPPQVKKKYKKSSSLDRRVQGILPKDLHMTFADAVKKTGMSESSIVLYAMNLVDFPKLIRTNCKK